MTTFAAVAVCTLLGALGVFQVVLASGAPLGRFAWGGQHRVLPRRLRISSAVSVALYALLGFLLLTRAGLLRPWASDWAVDIAAWVVAGYFFLGIWMNLASRSTPERALMTPVVAILCGLSIIVAAG
jgi:hypothetical protein